MNRFPPSRRGRLALSAALSAALGLSAAIAPTPAAAQNDNSGYAAAERERWGTLIKANNIRLG